LTATADSLFHANGNRASKSAGGVTETYVVDDADKLTSITVGGSAVKTYSYDTAGRTTSVVTSAGTTSLTYDYESRITQITYPSSATNTFTYNGLDTRVGKVDSVGTFTYKRDGDYVTAPVLEDGASKFTPGVSDRRGSSTRFYHHDRMGSVLRHTSSSQGSTASRQYDAFGNVATSSGTFVLPFGFAGNWGYQEDADSGLKLLGHRYYDSSTGRFITRDPIKNGRNWYGYCKNNPLKTVDPNGLQDINPMRDWVQGWNNLIDSILPKPAPSPGPTLVPGTTDVWIIPGASPFPGNACTPGPNEIWLPAGLSAEEFLEKPWWVNHELGHIEQARMGGIFYLLAILENLRLGAVTGGDPHDNSPMEKWASRRADYYQEQGRGIVPPRW
jgi:RHS repeat-associated protein